MAINLAKHRDSMLTAWKEVTDEKNATNWALFAYEGQTSDLKLVSKGDGGVEEMVDDLNSGKIMYAFCRVTDPTTSLPKFVLINWQGEGVTGILKGKCANHFPDVKRFLKGAHVTVNARTDEDVDPDTIIEKVAKSSGSAYSFKERIEPIDSPAPVGTNYKRIIPTQEISVDERDQFWQQEEEMEKLRVQEERRRVEEEKQKFEEERTKREIEEAKAREERAKARNRQISQLRSAERLAEQKVKDIERKKWDHQQVEDMKDEEERRQRSTKLRRERSEEAQALISQRTVDARAVFEQNTAAGQLHRRSKPPQWSEESNDVNHIVSPTSVSQRWPPPTAIEEPPKTVNNENIQNPVSQRWPPEQDSLPQAAGQDTSVTSHYLTEQQKAAPPTLSTGVQDTTESSHQFGNVDDINGQQNGYTSEAAQLELGLGENGIQAVAMYDYQAADDTEISFDPGDIITNIDPIDEGWWQGLAPDGAYGLFPANYVEIID